MTKARYKLYQDDCLEVLRKFKLDTFSALVTDPPAGIAFMGKEWDDDKGGRDQWIAWLTTVMRECLRVMKPGAHGLVWALPRTSHWTATALENAGFEVRDRVQHIFGSGLLNIDASRIGTERTTTCLPAGTGHGPGYHADGAQRIQREASSKLNPPGRFPSHLILDEEAAAMLDAQSGTSKSGGGQSSGKTFHGQPYVKSHNERPTDSGGASRFFYVAKASKSEKNAGIEGREEQIVDDGRQTPIDNPYLRGKTGRKNTHPTVKSVKLMQYLLKLVTPPSGIVLDPFMGSGSTGVAAVKLKLPFVGVEQMQAYLEIAAARIESAALTTADDEEDAA